jgi:hypothetical protein
MLLSAKLGQLRQAEIRERRDGDGNAEKGMTAMRRFTGTKPRLRFRRGIRESEESTPMRLSGESSDPRRQ